MLFASLLHSIASVDCARGARRSAEQFTRGGPIAFRAEHRRYAAHHMLVSHVHRLLICTIPKVGSTEFVRLFLRERGDFRWNRTGGYVHYTPNRPLFSRLDLENATAILNDPTWTKAVFFRDPLERLLSAYLDRLRSSAVLFPRFVRALAGAVPVALRGGNISRLAPSTDPHWRPQRYFCNLERFAPVYNFIGSFADITAHAEALLRRTGLWTSVGASGWGVEGGAMFQSAPLWQHASGAAQSYREHFTPELERLARDAYRADYRFIARLTGGGPKGVARSGGDARAGQAPPPRDGPCSLDFPRTMCLTRPARGRKPAFVAIDARRLPAAAARAPSGAAASTAGRGLDSDACDD